MMASFSLDQLGMRNFKDSHWNTVFQSMKSKSFREWKNVALQVKMLGLQYAAAHPARKAVRRTIQELLKNTEACDSSKKIAVVCALLAGKTFVKSSDASIFLRFVDAKWKTDAFRMLLRAWLNNTLCKECAELFQLFGWNQCQKRALRRK